MATTEIERFYDVRKEEGEIYNRVTSNRVFIFDAKAWNDMADHLAGIYSTGASSIFFNAGKLYAKRLMLTSERTTKSDEAITYFSELVKASGWGSFGIRATSDKIIVISKNFLMADRGKTEKPSCFFMKGILQGMGEALFGDKAKTEETLCRATATSNVCRFEISLR